MSTSDLAINLATLNPRAPLRDSIEACLRNGITAIGALRDQIAVAGPEEGLRIIRDNGLRVTSLVRAGLFPATEEAGRAAAIEDAKRAIDEAAALGAECLVILAGGLPTGSKDLAQARAMIAEGLEAILPIACAAGVPLALEPLHPMLAAERACVNTLEQALDICDQLGEGIGVVVDVYHLWWDPKLHAQIARAGASGRVLSHHICDWLVPTNDMLLDRGMMGDGVIDLPGIGASLAASGFKGPPEVEIFSAANWWTKPADDVLKTCIERFHACC